MEVVEHPPNFALLESGRFVWENILRNIFEEFVKNVEKCDKVDEFRGVFVVGGRNAFNDLVGHVLDFSGIIPDLIKLAEKISAILGGGCLGYGGKHVIAALTAEVNRSKTADWRITCFVHIEESHQAFRCDVGFESRFTPDPVRAFTGNGFLGQFVPKPDFKLRSVDPFFSLQAGNIELPAFLCYLVRDKCRGCENEAELINTFQF